MTSLPIYFYDMTSLHVLLLYAKFAHITSTIYDEFSFSIELDILRILPNGLFVKYSNFFLVEKYSN